MKMRLHRIIFIVSILFSSLGIFSKAVAQDITPSNENTISEEINPSSDFSNFKNSNEPSNHPDSTATPTDTTSNQENSYFFLNNTIFFKLIFYSSLIYLVLILNDLIDKFKIWRNNYGIPKAEKCNNNNCGFYTVNNKKDYCTNPRVKPEQFNKLKENGNQDGCKFSHQKGISVPKDANSETYLKFRSERQSLFGLKSPIFQLISSFIGLLLSILNLLNK